MPDSFLSQTKWKFTAHGQTRALVKGRSERPTHVIMKGFLWALYLPDYPTLSVEIRVGDRYKPDVVAMDAETGKPAFWGESGQVGEEKIHALVKRYRYTHFAIAKWATNLKFVRETVSRCLVGVKREAPFDVIIFPQNSGDLFVDADGNVNIKWQVLDWHRFEP